MRGRKEGRAERVAVVKCRLDVRRHVLKTLMRASGSGTYASEINRTFKHKDSVRTSIPDSNSN